MRFLIKALSAHPTHLRIITCLTGDLLGQKAGQGFNCRIFVERVFLKAIPQPGLQIGSESNHGDRIQAAAEERFVHRNLSCRDTRQRADPRHDPVLNFLT